MNSPFFLVYIFYYGKLSIFRRNKKTTLFSSSPKYNTKTLVCGKLGAEGSKVYDKWYRNNILRHTLGLHDKSTFKFLLDTHAQEYL
jgi:hypothetical protein